MTGINEVAKEIHENARAHGWWDEERDQVFVALEAEKR